MLSLPKQTGSSSTKGNHHPSFLRFLNWAEETVDAAAKICGGAENAVKTETQQTFVNGLLGFIILGIYTPLEARVCIAHNTGMSCLSIWATLSALLINILPWVPSSCFWHSDQPSEGEIIPFSVCLPVGGAYYPRRRRWWSRTDWQIALMCNRRRPAATSSRRASFSALASANSLRVFCIDSNITLTHLHVSNCRVRQLQFLAFLSRYQGNGVITVMINSPWQADDDADNQSGDNRGDSAHTSISDRSARFFEFCNQLPALCSNFDHNQRPQQAQILLQRSIAWRISIPINHR